MSSSGLFEKIGYSSHQRMLMFYLICIPLRLSFPFLLTFVENPIIILIGLVSIIQNYRTMESGTWWHRKAHIVTSIALILSTLLPGKYYPSIVLFFDVLYGIISSILIRPF